MMICYSMIQYKTLKMHKNRKVTNKKLFKQVQMYYGTERVQQTSDITCTRRTSGKPADTVAYADVWLPIWHHMFMMAGCHHEHMMSYQKSGSVNRCIFTWRTILQNFILIRFEMIEPWFDLKWRHAAILKVCHHITNLTPSVDVWGSIQPNFILIQFEMMES